ncbi:hypothetical protein OF83DRAFT_130220 [Amylostereum chailletii]|nr:hypothetical protein OF83DRAFT_130220 [Amylostereum chailletii]
MPSIGRARTHSGATDTQPRVDGISRSRTMSNVRIDPDHLFLSIRSPNILELSNIAFQATVDELRSHVFPMWPHGIDHQESFGHHWRVKFAGRPFSSTGHDGILMQRMICKIFWVLSTHGYVYLTSINTGRAFHAPRLVFIRAPSDPGSSFFSMTLSDSGDSVVFVDPHDVVTQSLGLALRSAFPRSVTTDTLMDDNILKIQLRTTFNGLGIDKSLFLAVILKHINDVMIKLDASVPLGRKGIFGFGSRRELWIFKASASWWEKNGRR